MHVRNFITIIEFYRAPAAAAAAVVELVPGPCGTRDGPRDLHYGAERL